MAITFVPHCLTPDPLAHDYSHSQQDQTMLLDEYGTDIIECKKLLKHIITYFMYISFTVLNNFKHSLVLQKQVSSYDGITPLCKYSSLRGNVQVSKIDSQASRGLSPRYKRIALKVLSRFPVVICFWGQKCRRLERLKSVPAPGSH